MRSFALIVLYLGLEITKLAGAVNCPTTSERCNCRASAQRNHKVQTMTCSGVWTIPRLNDTAPSASAQWTFIVEKSNDIGTINALSFSALQRQEVKIRRCRRLESIGNHAFKDARIDRLHIEGFAEKSIEIIESEAFQDMTSLSNTFGGCQWTNNYNHLECSTSLHISNVNTFSITKTSLVSLDTLQDLFISCHDLTIAPDSLSHLKNLEQLRIKNAKNFRPKLYHLAGLYNLRVLHMINLDFSFLPSDIFQDLKRLEILRLDRNSLAVLPVATVNLQRLTKLNLDKNNLADNAWKPLEDKPAWSELQSFTARDNKLTSVPWWLQKLTKVTHVNLMGNSILCDCRLAWLQTWPALLRDDGEKMFRNLGAVCDSGNWATCSRVCPFNCDLVGCINGLSKKECPKELGPRKTSKTDSLLNKTVNNSKTDKSSSDMYVAATIRNAPCAGFTFAIAVVFCLVDHC